MSRLLNRFRRDDRGNALLIAVMVVGVSFSLTVVGVQVALSSNRESGVDRQRLLGVSAAEAGVDGAFSAIARAAGNLPCHLTSANLRSGPDSASYTTDVTYYNAAGTLALVTGSGCTSGGTGQPVRAVVRSVSATNRLGGGSSTPTRVMESLIDLKPVTGNSLDKAIFANSNIGFTNATTVKGNVGSDGNLYTNASVTCTNNTSVAGNVYTQGSLTASNSCSFAGDVWAKTDISSSGPSVTIGGAAKAGTGKITINKGSVGGNLYAGSTISAPMCPGSRCFPNNSPGAPPVQPFPQLMSATAPWTAQGFTVVQATCANAIATIKSPGSGKRLVNVAPGCGALDLSKQDITVGSDLAVFSPGGYKTSNNTSFSAASGLTGLRLYLIQPYDAVAAPCTATGFSVSNLLTIDTALATLIYSPCTVVFTNHGDFTGQIYAGGEFKTSNNFDMQYKPLPVYGIVNGPPAAYTPSIVYKRETR